MRLFAAQIIRVGRMHQTAPCVVLLLTGTERIAVLIFSDGSVLTDKIIREFAGNPITPAVGAQLTNYCGLNSYNNSWARAT